MSKELTFTIQTEVDRNAIMWNVCEFVAKGLKAGAVVVTIGRPKRNTQQNALMWALLNEVAKQVEWYGQKLQPEDWKNVCSASLTKQHPVPAIDGGVVMIGASTSKMSKQQFSDLIEVIYAFGADQGVRFSEQVVTEYDQFIGVTDGA